MIRPLQFPVPSDALALVSFVEESIVQRIPIIRTSMSLTRDHSRRMKQGAMMIVPLTGLLHINIDVLTAPCDTDNVKAYELVTPVMTWKLFAYSPYIVHQCQRQQAGVS